MKTEFLEQMTRHWVQRLNRVCSDPLVKGWQQLHDAVCKPDHDSPTWRVLTLPTGTGKTEALKVLCSIPKFTDHPGALVVTRFRKDADKIAQDINDIAKANIAVAMHAEATINVTEPAFVPVLVTTHAAYRAALQELADGQIDRKLGRLHKFGLSYREWLIVDEAFDWTDSHSVGLGNIRAMAGDLCGALQGNANADAQTLHELAVILTDKEQCGTADRPITSDTFNRLAGLDFSGMRIEVNGIHPDVFAGITASEVPDTIDLKTDLVSLQASKGRYLALLDQLHTIVQIGGPWISRRKGKSLLHASRSLLDVGPMKGVILDATATLDPAYNLYHSAFTVLDRPENIRRYENVTLHLSQGHSVGKDHLIAHAGTEWAKLWGDLQTRIGGGSVLVVAHKVVLPALAGYELPQGDLQFANWGNLDGKNSWNECDTVVIFGLPYLNDITPTHDFIAACGPQSADWFAGSRQYGQHSDIIAKLKDGFIARSVIQAINRVRCRNPIDSDGSCKRTDVYLLLPNGRTGAHVRTAIEQQMPGIKVKAWAASGAKRKARKRPTQARLLDYFERAELGNYPKSIVAKAIGTNVRSFERTTRTLLENQSPLAKAMAELGAKYCTTTGRGMEAYFIKT